MSTTAVQEAPMRPQPPQPNNKRRTSNTSTISQKKFKHDRSGRKRSKSFSSSLGKPKSLKPVLPSKFLLGGNINDPLNLNSFQDEEINRAMNAVTPKSSPIPTPPNRRGLIEVIIPPNINDPLNLIGCADEAEYEQQMCSPVKKGRKKRLRKRRTTSGTVMELSDADASGASEAKTPESHRDSAKIPEVSDISSSVKSKELTLDLSPKKEKNGKRKSEEHKDAVKKLKHMMDKIVSPVVPQPGAWLKRTNSRNGIKHHRPPRNPNKEEKAPVFKDRNKQFQFGNYNRYYGYRNPQNEIDPRLKCFSHHRHLFENKDILDIGCNIGHITLSIARDFRAKSVVGIDIDKNLIGIARKNVKHYVISASPRNEVNVSKSSKCSSEVKRGRKKSSEFYPISMPILYGPIDIPGFSNDQNTRKGFPHNVTFVQGNYVLEDDSLLSTEQPQFDVILCLSITKWIHLNWGDTGIKQAFRRMYAQLKPGGKLILEPQNWASYKSKKKLTETIYSNYNSIEFFPEKFTQYLLSAEVGFAKSDVLGFPHHHSKGFQRPIQVFTKSTMYPSERMECPAQSSDNADKVYVPLPEIISQGADDKIIPEKSTSKDNLLVEDSSNQDCVSSQDRATNEKCENDEVCDTDDFKKDLDCKMDQDFKVDQDCKLDRDFKADRDCKLDQGFKKDQDRNLDQDFKEDQDGEMDEDCEIDHSGTDQVSKTDHRGTNQVSESLKKCEEKNVSNEELEENVETEANALSTMPEAISEEMLTESENQAAGKKETDDRDIENGGTDDIRNEEIENQRNENEDSGKEETANIRMEDEETEMVATNQDTHKKEEKSRKRESQVRILSKIEGE